VYSADPCFIVIPLNGSTFFRKE